MVHGFKIYHYRCRLFFTMIHELIFYIDADYIFTYMIILLSMDADSIFTYMNYFTIDADSIFTIAPSHHNELLYYQCRSIFTYMNYFTLDADSIFTYMNYFT